MLDRPTIERLGDGPLLIALSGGGDSVALLHLLHETLGPLRLHAACVDHGLRPGSAADAVRAASFAEKIGASARVLTLDWKGDARRTQEAAREARYVTLCAEARRVSAQFILLGHTRDDQAETVLLRAARGSGWRGLSGMAAIAPAPLWPEGRGLRLARPLLGARRAALRDALRARGVDWIEDPANANAAFARVRAREALAQMPGLDPMRLATLAERLAPRAAALDARALALIRDAASFDADRIAIARVAWRGPRAVRARALAVLIAAAGAHPRGPALEQAAELTEQIESAGFKGATLAGAALAARAGGVIVVRRDPGALAGRADGATAIAALSLPAHAEAVWDRRLALTAREPGWSVIVESGTPVLARRGARAPIADAAPRWLLRERVEHLLGQD